MKFDQILRNLGAFFGPRKSDFFENHGRGVDPKFLQVGMVIWPTFNDRNPYNWYVWTPTELGWWPSKNTGKQLETTGPVDWQKAHLDHAQENALELVTLDVQPWHQQRPTLAPKNTPPKTNMEPDNQWLEDEQFLFNSLATFRFYLSFGIDINYPTWIFFKKTSLRKNLLYRLPFLP